MIAWQELNTRGKVLYVMCILNLCLAFLFATMGLWISLFHVLYAFILSISTYDKRNQVNFCKDSK